MKLLGLSHHKATLPDRSHKPLLHLLVGFLPIVINRVLKHWLKRKKKFIFSNWAFLNAYMVNPKLCHFCSATHFSNNRGSWTWHCTWMVTFLFDSIRPVLQMPFPCSASFCLIGTHKNENEDLPTSFHSINVPLYKLENTNLFQFHNLLRIRNFAYYIYNIFLVFEKILLSVINLALQRIFLNYYNALLDFSGIMGLMLEFQLSISTS